MFDHKIKIFHTVAKRLSFSKAADELHISQPAITRHIKQFEDYFNQKLFDRKGNSIQLTEAGKVFFHYTILLLKQYEKLNFEMNLLINKNSGKLPIAASTTIAQYVLPSVLAGFYQRFKDVNITLTSQNTEKVEKAILNKTVELGFIEGKVKNREIAYYPFLKDEIVLVVSQKHFLARKQEITLEELKSIPILLREQGSGTLQVILEALQDKCIKISDLSMEMQLGSSESIKSYLYNHKTAAFLSVHTVLKELKTGDFFVVDIQNLEIKRNFYYITQQGAHSPLVDLFINYLKHSFLEDIYKS